MLPSWRRAAALALSLFLAMFLLRLLVGPGTTIESGGPTSQMLEGGQRNYASSKLGGGAPSALPLEAQKYEKIATLVQASDAFEPDRQKLLTAITGHSGMIQIERASGLAGRRVLALGIGVPPERFDDFVKVAQGIGRSTQITVVKNDKTNEYLQLKAKRVTLEKSRTALTALGASGGSVDERVKVQNLLTEIEDKLQGLGVSLGEFDSQNELCTVKLTLAERVAPVGSFGRRIIDALQWTVLWYGGAALALLLAICAAWLAFALAAAVRRALRA